MNKQKQHKNQQRSFQQGGFSLIELLVGLVIGLFLLMGMSTYFVQNKETYAYQKSQATQQEHERILSSLLGRALRQAGFAPMTTDRLTGPEVVFKADGGNFGNGQVVFGTEATHTVAVNGVATAQTYPADTLSIRYIGDGTLTRCNGSVPALASVSTDTISVDGVRFNCNLDGTTDNLLFGSEDVPEAQQLRVLGMAVSYGEDTDGDGSVDAISRASAVTDWSAVVIAQLEIHFQAGTRAPQANSFVFAIENSLGVDLL